MTQWLGHTPAGQQHLHNPPAKNVDEVSKRLRFSWDAAFHAGALGSGIARKLFLKNLTSGKVSSADGILSGTKFTTMPLSASERLAADKADLSDEALDIDNSPKLASCKVAGYLPEGLRQFLQKMDLVRQRQRQQAIIEYFGEDWADIKLLNLDAEELAEKAIGRAAKYAIDFPGKTVDGDLINQEPEHQKRRCEKWWRRRLRKRQARALLYVEQAVGAVGGPNVASRPLYISDYLLALHEEEEERTAKILDRLRLVKKKDPKVQIPMSELHERAKLADATKKRLLIDAHLMRWKSLGWHVCWLTVTLPGAYVANSTNEECRVSKWNPKFGPEEAAKRLQDEHHRVLMLLREKGVRPSGFWNAQPQQSGTPHRHYVVACQSIEDARKVCDEFHRKFDTGVTDDDRKDRGCAAYVIGDFDSGYAPPKGKNGHEETAASIAKYAARYATRYNAKETTEDKPEDSKEAKAQHDFKRFRAWKKKRGARGMGWLGLDSQRAPSELWDVLWLNSLKEDDRWYGAEDARMSLAMREMRISRRKAEDAMLARSEMKAAREALKLLLDAGISSNELEATEKAVEAADTAVRDASGLAAHHGWHAAVAIGLWQDTDLDPAELQWLQGQVDEWNKNRWALADSTERDSDPLPPVPLREHRESIYGVVRQEIKGTVGTMRKFNLPSRLADRGTLFAAAATAGFLPEFEARLEEQRQKTWKRISLSVARRLFFLTARDKGYGFSKRPDGRIAGYDRSGEILLRTEDEWIIVDKATAEAMLHGIEGGHENANLMSEAVALSFSATDPRKGAAPLLEGKEEVSGAPPG